MGSDLQESLPRPDPTQEEPARPSGSSGSSGSSPPAPVASAAAAPVDAEDDWAGLCDRKERRRRQNRLNQRAYRKRKQAERNNALVPRPSAASQVGGSPNPEHSSSPDSDSSLTPKQSRCMLNVSNGTSTPSMPIDIQKLFEHFTRVAYESYFRGSPSADHLLTLSKVNVFRAFVANMSVLGLGKDTTWCQDDDALSLFNTLSPDAIEGSTDKLPVALRPTKLQIKIPHHPWLDFFPLPRLRDNLVMMADRFDDEELCHDVMGFWDNASDSCSMLVWGEPSDPASWEVTEGFLRKWPWVVRGCPELLQSTNRWRQSRGEKMIIRYL
ncbi:DUF3425 domain-containing protein [Aspergillus ibericus CBS 121593]|uniref:BZIP domain-containing protein n=1 Tax=Aspergillus ibericus CBS 121593 TaxID=1448316 RepID=A0A395GV18_9EURO|nr:hypothetical protein BO80DRAFT_426609 [Aspergillus ibericus CBS 121593]RAK99345.1 hypothetical protein BO80DRAFT_426609 [Aspergillus ibericus CBS 121593]